MKKAQIWISAIIYTLVAMATVMLILNTGVPLLTQMKDRAVFEKVKEIMLDLDKQVTEIAGQGEGSQTSASIDVREGEITFENNEMAWEIETKKPVISPKTSTVMGNLIIASNANVRTYVLENYFVMETTIKNDTFSISINRLGNQDNWVAFNTSGIIHNITYNNNDMPGRFDFKLNNFIDSYSGTGYVKMYPEGNYSRLGSAKVVAHMNTIFAEYDLEYVLESYSDFVSVRVRNVKMD